MHSVTKSLKEIAAATDDELREWQDGVATGRAVGHDYYLGELRARETQRAIEATNKLSRRVYWLTVVNAIFAAIAIVVAIIAILVPKAT